MCPSLRTLTPLHYTELCGGCSCLACREREVQDVKMELQELQRNPPKPTTDEATAVGKG